MIEKFSSFSVENHTRIDLLLCSLFLLWFFLSGYFRGLSKRSHGLSVIRYANLLTDKRMMLWKCEKGLPNPNFVVFFDYLFIDRSALPFFLWNIGLPFIFIIILFLSLSWRCTKRNGCTYMTSPARFWRFISHYRYFSEPKSL